MPATLTPKPARLIMPAATQAWLIGYIGTLQHPNPRRIRAGLIFRNILWAEGIESNAIPGYDRPPRDCGTGAPRGWSLQSFRALAQVAHAKSGQILIGKKS